MERARGEHREEEASLTERRDVLEKTEAFYGRLAEKARKSDLAKGLVGLMSLLTVEGCTVAGLRVEPAVAIAEDPVEGKTSVSGVLRVEEVRQRSYTEILERMEEPERALRDEGEFAPCQGQTCLVMRETVPGVEFLPMEVTDATKDDKPKIAGDSIASLQPAAARAVARARALLVWEHADYRIAKKKVSFDIDPRSMEMRRVRIGSHEVIVTTPSDGKAYEAVYFVPLEDKPEEVPSAGADVPHF